MFNETKQLLSVVLLTTGLAACTQANREHQHGNATGEPKIDSLKSTVMAVHDSVMPKMDEIMNLRLAAQARLRQLDSAAQTDPNQRTQLTELMRRLDAADEAMMQWMQAFDGQMNNKNTEQKTAYLLAEKNRIDSVRNLMLGSIAEGKRLLR
ncbi:MAG: hypothetical protein MUD08_00615 [Cytophagales bacterium]|jgi:DNA repair protein RadC|nr:hypothetical protein [Cytophagales bacterium]